ncbi:hypothetical protein Tco_0057338, partial [Tanacetum coccineum]
MPSVEPAHMVPFAKVMASENRGYRATDSADENLKLIFQNRSEFVQITKKTPPSATVGNVKQIPALKLGQGLEKSKIQTRPIISLRRPNTVYPKSDYHQVGWNYSTNQGYQFQPPNFGSWGPYPPFPYMNQPNVKLVPDKWIKDSGCSRHMTGNKDPFSTYEAINEGNVVFGSNTKSKIIGK